MILLLIQANDTKLRDGSSWPEQNRRYAYAPTTLTTLAGLVPPELKADIEIIDEGVQILRENFEADIVGISAATPNAPRAYKIARRARERGMKVVLGGWHPTLMTNELL